MLICDIFVCSDLGYNDLSGTIPHSILTPAIQNMWVAYDRRILFAS
jgi:hypothetical protein